MKKVLIIGIKGMAGHMLFQSLPKLGKYDVYGIGRDIAETNKTYNLDVSQVCELQKIVTRENFDAIVNCIGILNENAEDQPDAAIWVNSYFPHLLERITKNTDTQVIHISTDCVFSGKKGNYTEDDIRDGEGFYAQSKALGELNNSKDITIRTSIVGPELNRNGIGLFHWFMSQPPEAIVNGYTKAFWSGITTLELAKVVHDVLTNKVSGLKEIAPSEKISKYEMLLLFNEIFKNNSFKIVPYDGYAVDKSLISIRHDYIYNTPTYREMFLEMKQWMNNEKNSYHY